MQPPIGATLMQTSSLLERLPPTEAGASTVQALIAELATAKSDSAVAGIITRTADLVHERSEHLARQRQQTAAILAAVTKRLEEMAG